MLHQLTQVRPIVSIVSNPPLLQNRTIHFYANSDKAKMHLGWTPKHDFLKDVDELTKAYFASGRDKKDIDFTIDDKIISSV